MKIINKLKINQNALKLTSVFLAFAIATFGSIAALAWGPERQTYTIEKPADKVTFNSITNNPNYGDERNFTIAKLTSEGTDKWRDVVEVSENAEYTIRVYVHNNAADNLKLTAENTRVKASIPTTLSNQVTIQGQISASNATPQDIWDQVVFKSDSKKFNIAYVAGSTRYYNNVNPSEGFQLSDDIITNTGSLLGYEKMDGKIPGCFQYSGIVTFKVKTQVQKQADFNVSKQVRKVGETEWQKTVKAKPGDKIEYRIGYDNVGESTQNNVIAKDALPKGITYVSDSTYLKNASNPNGDGMKLASNDLTTKGVNIGNYAPNSNAFVKFTAQIAEAKDLSCGSNKLTNKVNVSTENGAKENTADVEVDVECKDNECKPGVPEGSAECEDTVVPTELPKTGPMEAALMIIAVTAITGGVAYWYRSREEVKKATAGLTPNEYKINPDEKDITKESKKENK